MVYLLDPGPGEAVQVFEDQGKAFEAYVFGYNPLPTLYRYSVSAGWEEYDGAGSFVRAYPSIMPVKVTEATVQRLTRL